MKVRMVKGERTLRNNAGNRSVPPNPRIVKIPDDYCNLYLVVINVSTNCFHTNSEQGLHPIQHLCQYISISKKLIKYIWIIINKKNIYIIFFFQIYLNKIKKNLGYRFTKSTIQKRYIFFYFWQRSVFYNFLDHNKILDLF